MTYGITDELNGLLSQIRLKRDQFAAFALGAAQAMGQGEISDSKIIAQADIMFEGSIRGFTSTVADLRKYLQEVHTLDKVPMHMVNYVNSHRTARARAFMVGTVNLTFSDGHKESWEPPGHILTALIKEMEANVPAKKQRAPRRDKRFDALADQRAAKQATMERFKGRYSQNHGSKQ